MFEKNFNSTVLSKTVGITQSTICSYLRGESLPYYDKLIILADYFGCSTDFLLGLENENYTQKFIKCPPFSERIKVVVKESGKSQYRIIKDCNIPSSTFDYWKKGKTTPSSVSLIKLANYLGRTVDYILGRSN